MKAKHLRHAVICTSCNQHPFVKLTADGTWYWCLTCDAHQSACKSKGRGVSASTTCCGNGTGCIV